MSFDLPNAPHVVYNDQRLREVVAQLRFHPLYRIVATPPADFQEAIRQSYPIPEVEDSASLQVVIGSNPEAQRKNVPPSARIYRFRSADENWTVSLAQDFVALSVTNYSDFSEFAKRLDEVVSLAGRIYSIPNYTRIGLRYVNFFEQELGGPTDLLRPDLLGLIATPLGSNVSQSAYQAHLSDGDHSVTLNLVNSEVNFGVGVLFDIDHFTAKTANPEDVSTVLTKFHDVNYKLFRWSITDYLHQKMDPRDA